MEKYFVPWQTAALLQSKGFDEPCFFYYEDDVLIKVQDKIEVTATGWQTIKNSEIIHNVFTAAPLYDQVFDWLESRGIRIHDLYIFFEKKRWCAHVYCMKTGKMLWGPVMNESSTIDFRAYQHTDKREAWNTAIIEALKLINKNEDDREAKERPGKGKEDAPQL